MCGLCDSNFDFRKVAIQDVMGAKSIVLTGSLKDSNEGNRFRFCPLCGCKLDRRRFNQEEGKA